MKLGIKTQKNWDAAYAIAAVLTGSSALAAEPPIVPRLEMTMPSHPEKPQLRAKPVAHATVQAPALEPPTTTPANAGFNTTSAFAAAAVPTPDSSTLSPPVTISYSGGSPVLQINDSGTNKGVLSQITNSHNSTSALYGVTNGSGAGLTGYNSGTSGPAGKFGVTNSNSSQPGISTTTNGSGSALLGTITTADSYEPAILGQNVGTLDAGIGVEGDGGEYGVFGSSAYAGLYGSGKYYGLVAESSTGAGASATSNSGIGLYAYGGGDYGASIGSASGIGVYGFSHSNYGVSAESVVGSALLAKADETGTAVTAESTSGWGILVKSTSSYALVAESNDSIAVTGEDFGSGIGVYGYSVSGYAGYFQGKLGATSYVTLSDRNTKTRIRPVDNKDILDKVDRLPVSSWVFKDDLNKNHVGPMAQDFHATFGLDGDDDKHINLTDIVGVSLASIQELSKELKEKDFQLQSNKMQIAELRDQLKALSDTFSARVTALEQQHGMWLATQTASVKKENHPLGE